MDTGADLEPLWAAAEQGPDVALLLLVLPLTALWRRLVRAIGRDVHVPAKKVRKDGILW